MKITKIYLLYSGCFGDDGYLYQIFKYKKDAIAHIRKYEGYIKDEEREDPFYENLEKEVWLRIDESFIYGD